VPIAAERLGNVPLEKRGNFGVLNDKQTQKHENLFKMLKMPHFQMLSLMGGFTTPQCAVNAAFENNAEGAGGAGGGVAGGSSSSGPVNPRGIRMPPPVARVTRRTAINQHEQLRRLRGEERQG
jgi:hypothetical protein